MSEQARTCPNCKQANYGLSEFCARCGADLQTVTADFLPWALHNQLPNMPWAAHDAAIKHRATNPDSPGTGLVWSGIIVTIIGLAIDLAPAIQFGTTSVGLGLILLGLWQLRRDYVALSRNGRWLVLLGLVALGTISWRVIEPDPPSPSRILAASGSTSPKATRVAAPEGVMLMHRGGAAHLGVTSGPAPSGNIYRSWRFDTGGELYSSPAISGNQLIIGSKSGFLYALDATNGTELWSRDIGEYIVRSTPAIADDVLFINDGYLVLALSMKDGTTLWTADVPFTGSTSPTYVDGLVYIASQNGRIAALDAATGVAKWTVQVDGLIFGSPTVDAGRVYVANDRGTVTALRADTGASLWAVKAGGGVFAPIISSGDALYLTTNEGKTLALTAEFGKVVWTYDAGGSSGAALGANQLVVTSDDGGVTALNPNDGSILWSVATGSTITTGPTIAGDLVMVPSGQSVHTYRLADGTKLYTYATGYTVQISPVVLNGLIYIGGRDGYLDALAGDIVPSP
ncbi:MAG TPA: PQQ-binding-like beta-propeller repeat protein [Thermomicrobiales bacterium]|nr:PQQ-binding-like beta-propeller repeat protein [Thermomicrobiales bacterium]